MTTSRVRVRGRFVQQPETPARLQRARALRAEGKKLREIAAELGVTLSGAGRMVRGAWRRPAGTPPARRPVTTSCPARAAAITAAKMAYWGIRPAGTPKREQAA